MQLGAEKGSLERGLALLRLFKPGVSSLGNGELAERAAMARSTVTRITHQLVEYGFLQKDDQSGGFKLAPVVLSLAEAYSVASPILKVCLPLMRSVATKLEVDVNLAMLDFEEMVYVETVRHRKEALERRVRPGHRIPVELTSAGKAWLATLPAREFKRRLDALSRGTSRTLELRRDLLDARSEYTRWGYCSSPWMTSLTAIATPLAISEHERFYLSFSISLAEANEDRVRQVYGPALRDLANRIQHECGVLIHR
jgi:DNA-binding IclR family transcriptional regulator